MPDIHRVRTVFTGVAGTPWYSNQYYALEGAGSGDVRVATANFWTDIANAGSALVDWTVEGQTTVIDSETGLVLRVEPGADQTGGYANTGNELPWQTQMLVSLRSNHYVAGRELRGKIFLPGFVSGNCEDGVFSSVALAVVQDALDEWHTATDDLMIIWSKTHSFIANVQAMTAQAKPSVLRSRRD